MSLLNDMLRDLDKRRARHSPAQNNFFSGVQAVNPRVEAKKFSISITSLMLLGLLLLVLLIGLRWQIHEKHLLAAAYQHNLVNSAQASMPKAKPIDASPNPAPTVTASSSIPTQQSIPPIQEQPVPAKPMAIHKAPVALSPMEQADQAFTQIQDLIDRGDLTLAQQRLEKLLIRYPRHEATRLALVNLLIQQENPQRAQRLLRIGLHLSPDYAPFAETLAHLLAEQKHYQQALHVLLKARPLIEDNPDYYAFIAALYEHTGQFAKSLALYQALLQLEPNNAIWWLGMGISAEGVGQKEVALQAYQRAHQHPELQPHLQTYVRKRLAFLQGYS